VEVNWIKTHARIVAGVAAAGLAGLVFLVVWFQPQTAFIDDVVNDTIPVVASVQQDSNDDGSQTTDDGTEAESEEEMDEDMEEEAEGAVTEPAAGEVPPSFPLTLGEGAFIDLAHTGTGVARVIELEDGTRILRFEDLDVLNGPDLRVILSPSALVEDDGAYDDGAFIDLGPLKGNKGNQNYEIPPEIDLDDFATVAIWCRRFNVSFNAAPIGS
jgi:hypothetical protein